MDTKCLLIWTRVFAAPSSVAARAPSSLPSQVHLPAQIKFSAPEQVQGAGGRCVASFGQQAADGAWRLFARPSGCVYVDAPDRETALPLGGGGRQKVEGSSQQPAAGRQKEVSPVGPCERGRAREQLSGCIVINRYSEA